MIDYHIHTLLCNHAEGSMESYVQSAINFGMSEICFQDHLTIQKSEERLSMAPDEIPFYFHAIQLLKHQYKGIINIKAGIEIDFTRTIQTFSMKLSAHMRLMLSQLHCTFQAA